MNYYDSVETRNPEDRERYLMDRLPRLVAHAKERSPYFFQLFAGVNPFSIHTREALATLPLTRKSDMLEIQKKRRPFGGMTTVPDTALKRIFSSPGPIYEPQGRGPDAWRFARAMHAAGFRQGDIVHNCFSYHLTPGAFMFEGGANKLGCPVFPGGVGQTEMQIQAMEDIRSVAYVGTPSFLKIILDRAQEMKADITSLRKGLVSGEALLPAVREQFASQGLEVFQCYATADVGMIAYESSAHSGLIVDEDIIVEIVRPGTGDPVALGEIGEVVVTCFNPDYPLVRFATGDLSQVLPGVSPCGRTNVRLKGLLGRADQTTKVRGMFVRPEQVTEVVKRFPAVCKARLIVDNETGLDRMVLKCEVTSISQRLDEDIVQAVRDVTKLRADVVLVAPGSLPEDEAVIEDVRRYD